MLPIIIVLSELFLIGALSAKLILRKRREKHRRPLAYEIERAKQQNGIERLCQIFSEYENE